MLCNESLQTLDRSGRCFFARLRRFFGDRSGYQIQAKVESLGSERRVDQGLDQGFEQASQRKATTSQRHSKLGSIIEITVESRPNTGAVCSLLTYTVILSPSFLK